MSSWWDPRQWPGVLQILAVLVVTAAVAAAIVVPMHGSSRTHGPAGPNVALAIATDLQGAPRPVELYTWTEQDDLSWVGSVPNFLPLSGPMPATGAKITIPSAVPGQRVTGLHICANNTCQPMALSGGNAFRLYPGQMAIVSLYDPRRSAGDPILATTAGAVHIYRAALSDMSYDSPASSSRAVS